MLSSVVVSVTAWAHCALSIAATCSRNVPYAAAIALAASVLAAGLQDCNVGGARRRLRGRLSGASALARARSALHTFALALRARRAWSSTDASRHVSMASRALEASLV